MPARGEPAVADWRRLLGTLLCDLVGGLPDGRGSAGWREGLDEAGKPGGKSAPTELAGTCKDLADVAGLAAALVCALPLGLMLALLLTEAGASAGCGVCSVEAGTSVFHGAEPG